MPSQKPLVEQEAAPRSLHVLRGSGAPTATFKHCPGEPGKLQLRHAPVQLLSQHTPSTHWPDSHWLASAQGCPFFILPQVPVVTPLMVCCTHWCPSSQSVSVVQMLSTRVVGAKEGRAVQKSGFPASAMAVARPGRVFDRPEQEEGPHTVFFG